MFMLYNKFEWLTFHLRKLENKITGTTKYFSFVSHCFLFSLLKLFWGGRLVTNKPYSYPYHKISRLVIYTISIVIKQKNNFCIMKYHVCIEWQLLSHGCSELCKVRPTWWGKLLSALLCYSVMFVLVNWDEVSIYPCVLDCIAIQHE